ncbi:MAG: DUF1015 domain-containing protein [Armatimonadetes bacterium]|nr:DUF1015 domain-containing protein [Armatimonadota bacterium]
MATIRPLKGLRYSEKAGELDRLTAPPYDVISATERVLLESRSPYNVVKLTLPERHDDDRSQFVKYARSAATLADWRREGILNVEPQPAIYRYLQTFKDPYTGESHTRSSFIALLKTEPYSKGIVLPHEQTFPKHKADRMRILEATRAHLECILGLYEDPSGSILEALKSAPATGSYRCVSDEGTTQILEPIADGEAVKKLCDMLSDKKVWIADGHHRYETACEFRETLGEKDGLIPEDFILMAFSSIADPGLLLLPTHRIIEELPYGKAEILRRLETLYDMQAVHSTRLSVDLRAADGQVFGLALPGGEGYILRAKDQSKINALTSDVGSKHLSSLDVTVLHKVILEHLLEVKGLDSIEFTRDPKEAILAADEGHACAFLMNAPTVEDMKVIATGGEKMPQKSTYYFPKVLSGLVLWSLNDF